MTQFDAAPCAPEILESESGDTLWRPRGILMSLKPHLKLKFAVILIGLCFVVSGCSSVSDDTAATLASDPSLYEFYDCAKIADTRKALTAQAASIRKQIDITETSVGGSIINEAVYQPDLIKLRGSLKRLDDAWQRQKIRQLRRLSARLESQRVPYTDSPRRLWKGRFACPTGRRQAALPDLQ
jgi:hypothetical protein